MGYTLHVVQPISHNIGSFPLAWGIRNCLRQCLLSKKVHSHSRGVYRSAQPKLPYRCPVHSHSRGVYTLHIKRFPFPSWFIPTRVGYTLRRTAGGFLFGGSFPLAWGIQLCINCDCCTIRFIPTRVGYTYSAHETAGGLPFIPTRVGYTPQPQLLFPLLPRSFPLAWGIH